MSEPAKQQTLDFSPWSFVQVMEVLLNQKVAPLYKMLLGRPLLALATCNRHLYGITRKDLERHMIWRCQGDAVFTYYTPRHVVLHDFCSTSIVQEGLENLDLRDSKDGQLPVLPPSLKLLIVRCFIPWFPSQLDNNIVSWRFLLTEKPSEEEYSRMCKFYNSQPDLSKCCFDPFQPDVRIVSKYCQLYVDRGSEMFVRGLENQPILKNVEGKSILSYEKTSKDIRISIFVLQHPKRGMIPSKDPAYLLKELLQIIKDHDVIHGTRYGDLFSKNMSAHFPNNRYDTLLGRLLIILAVFFLLGSVVGTSCWFVRNPWEDHLSLYQILFPRIIGGTSTISTTDRYSSQTTK